MFLILSMSVHPPTRKLLYMLGSLGMKYFSSPKARMGTSRKSLLNLAATDRKGRMTFPSTVRNLLKQ